MFESTALRTQAVPVIRWVLYAVRAAYTAMVSPTSVSFTRSWN